MAPGPQPLPALRPRPVGELPLDGLIGGSDELARSWAIAFVARAPFGRIGEIPLDRLAQEGPSLCEHVLRALQSERELERLTGLGGPSGREDAAPSRRLARMVGAREPAGLAAAVEALRLVLWAELAPALRDLPPGAQAEVCDRLAGVCAILLATALESPPAENAAGTPAERTVIVAREPAAADRGNGGEVPRAAIVDEGESSASRGESREAGTHPGARVAIVDELPDQSQRFVPVAVSRPEQAPSSDLRDPEIEVRDQRAGQGPAAWIGSIGAQLQRFSADGLPFAVLLLELGDLEPRGAPVDERLATAVEHLLAGEVAAAARLAVPGESAPAPGLVTRERSGRYWLVVSATDREAATALADRLAAGIGALIPAPGLKAPRVSIGAAVCPQDGTEAAALAAHADLSLHVARTRARA